MLIIFRWWYFLGIGGIGLTAFGAVETGHELDSEPEPALVSLAALESGAAPPQPYVRLGANLAMYPMLAYQERSGRIENVCYPLISEDHAYVQAWRKLAERYGDADVPPGEVPVLDGVRVYAFDKQWKQLADLPSDTATNESLEGLLFPVKKLGDKERQLLVTSSGRPVQSDVLVLEVGRKPRSLLTCIQFLAVGVALLVLAVLRFFKKPKPAQ